MANFVVYHVLNTDVKDEKISATIIIIPIIKIKFSVVFNPLSSYKLNPIPLSRMPGLAIRLINGKMEKKLTMFCLKILRKKNLKII